MHGPSEDGTRERKGWEHLWKNLDELPLCFIRL